MPEPIFALVDSATALFGFVAQATGELADGAADVAQGAIEVANPAVDGEVDPLTGEPLGDLGDLGTGPDGAAANPAAQAPPNFFFSLLQNPLSLFAGLMILFYVMVLLPERRKQAAAAAKRSALKKNDRVVTTGGIFGTVVSAAADSNEVTLRIDDSNNIRIRVLKSAIGSVLDPGKEDSST